MAGHDYEVGLRRDQIDTPALLLDLEAMERNLRTMARFFAERKVRLRPHVKLHRATPALAHKQLDSGAVGLTCAKLTEAETLAASGVRDILIANQIVGERKIRRLANLASYTDVIVAVDSYDNVRSLSAAAHAHGVVLRVVVDVNIGHDRCGVAPLVPALALARAAHEAPGIHFAGLMGYDGHCTLGVTDDERPALSRQANQLLAETRFLVEGAGLPVEIVSAGGTLTYRYASAMEGITEIQAGTYLLMDTAFREHGLEEFACALTVLATVISRPSYPGADHLAVVDLGSKGMSTQLGPPEIKAPSGARLIKFSQEHGRVHVQHTTSQVRIGDKIEFWVRDANGTINLCDRFYAMRGEVVEAVWDIPAPGCRT